MYMVAYKGLGDPCHIVHFNETEYDTNSNVSYLKQKRLSRLPDHCKALTVIVLE